MSNPIYDSINQNTLTARFNQFKSNFSGDPRQKVQELLNSGRVSQEQYNRAVRMANQLQGLLRYK